MFRWPTSEFPICPRGRPTASSEASIVVCAQERHRRSQFGLTARLIALSGASSRHPTPSRISSTTGTTSAAAAGCSVIGELAIASRSEGLRYHFTFIPCIGRAPRPAPVSILQFLQNNWPLVLVMLVSGAMLAWPLIGSPLSTMREIGAVQATQLINRKDALILDLREAKEYEGGRVPNALHIPLSQLASRGKELGKFTARPLI